MAWVARRLSAPEVLSAGVRDGVGWLHTAALPGRSAIELPAEVAVPALGRALRAFHDALRIADCPWTRAAEDRLAAVSGGHDLGTPPPVDRLVVCHGDPCNPNFLLDDRGACTGYVDLARVGVADRWADLAQAVLSLGWNFGPGHEGAFLEAYGVGRDARLGWYQRLWQAE
ncbi:phosphotransferase [Mariniluteicoccus flavus]